MTHTQKVKLARRMITKKETGTPIFQSAAWEKRKESKKAKLIKKLKPQKK